MFKSRVGKSTLKAPRASRPKVSRISSASFSRDGFNDSKLAAKNKQEDFYKSEQWKNLRAQCFARDGYKCVECGSTDGLDAHHIRPRSKGGADTLGNVKTLCETHHQCYHSHNLHRR